MTDMQRFGDVVVSEHVAVIDDEYRWHGETRHRQHRRTGYAACCLICSLTFEDALLPRVRRWAQDHICGVTP